jgi:nucleotide-binding universal stress UspA family protein
MAGHVTLQVLQDPPCPVYVLRSALDSATQAHRLRHLRHIVVPLDGSMAASRAIAEACVLAVSASAHLTMLHVINTVPGAGRAPASPLFIDHPHHELEAWEDEFVRSSFASGIEKVPDHLTVALRVGDPAEEILRYAAEADADLIVPCCSGLFTPGRARVVSSLLCRANAPLLFIISQQVAAEGADNVESGAYVA